VKNVLGSHGTIDLAPDGFGFVTGPRMPMIPFDG